MLLDITRDAPVLTLEGEVDASNSAHLAVALEPEARRGGVVAVDMNGLDFIDAAGADVLLDTAERLRGRGRLLLCRPSAPVRRVLDVLRANRMDGMAVVSAPPDEVLRDQFSALARWDPDAIHESLADDAVWHLPGRNEFSGTHRGKDEILSVAARVKEFTSEFIQQVDDVLAGDEHVAVLGNVWGDREGKILFGAREVTTFRMDGARVVEAWSYLFDPAGFDDFWT
ncbi:MAG: STAS domain-containing protein [Actinomycetota bacterium]